MADSDETPVTGSLDPSIEREVYRLCDRIYEGVQSSGEMERFNRLLDASAAARRIYLRCVGLHCGLLTHAGRDRSERVDALRRYVTAADSSSDEGDWSSLRASDEVDPSDTETTVQPLRERRRGWRRAGLAVAATLLLAVAWGLQLSDWEGRSTVQPASVLETGAADVSAGDVVPALARITYVSSIARASREGGLPRRGASVAVGDSLDITSGVAELTYASGSRLLLIAPACFTVADGGGRLESGGLVASVTKAGRGFTIDTPNGRVVDLGTEFGVAVDDFGVSEVSVFAGAVEAYPMEGSTGPQRKIDLAKGRGLQWDKGSLISLNAKPQSFASSVLDRWSRRGDVEGEGALATDFLKPEFEKRDWTLLGDVEPTGQGMRLRGSGDRRGPPYLISARQFDPSEGPVLITCDFRVVGDVRPDAPLFAVLTRSTSDRGISLPPWSGAIAASVRCSFESGTEGGEAEGTLRAGVKMESTREVTSIFQRGAFAPSRGAVYRAVVRDDGVNVSMTISQRDGSSLSTTMSCRSLFRGAQNFVAFEGPADGATVIERVEIVQGPQVPIPASYDGFSESLRDSTSRSRAEEAILASLAPVGADLVSYSAFDEKKLDGNRWRLLGDALLRDDGIQLGLANESGHIDTWRRRPYLITRQEFDPGDGAVTVTGRVTFSENFLNGFGATFGVLTRCDAEYGDGPEWEQSVLRQGVRATLWPSAWNRQRRLEVYERELGGSMTLLANEGAEVDPQQRSYLFRLTDTGDSVRLTIIDPDRPGAPFSVVANATTAVRRGPIALESCWGSPVILDDISVYQTRVVSHGPE